MSLAPTTQAASNSLAVLLMLLVLTAISDCYSPEVLYVRPTLSTQCLQEPCHTLSQYFNPADRSLNISLSNVTKVVLLPGKHTLNATIVIQNLTTFTFTGDTTSLPSITTTITCSGNHQVIFDNVTYLEVNAVEFQLCGSYLGTVYLYSVNISEFKSVSFQHNTNVSIIALHSFLHITNGHFINNSAVFGGGITAIQSTISLTGKNYFINNSAKQEGGAVYAHQCTIYMEGLNSFMGNTATKGGGLYCISSSLKASGTVTFINNSVISEFSNFTDSMLANAGGGIAAEYSNFTSNTTSVQFNFRNNKAGTGSAMYCSVCILNFHGNFTVIENYAYNGGVFIFNTNLTSHGTISFQHNSAINFAAGIFAIKSTVAFLGTSNVINNTANDAGAMSLLYSTFLSHGRLMLRDNSANNITGGVFVIESNVQIYQESVFAQNRASQVCAITAINSSIIFNGSSNFFGHSSAGAGVLLAYSSTIAFFGNTTFTNNAGDFGACVAAVLSDIHFNGVNTFQNNSGTLTGGALWIGAGSSLSIMGINTFTYNTAIQGCAVFGLFASVHIEGVTSITNNVISGDGRGAVNIIEGNVSITGKCLFANNTAEVGTGISVRNSILTMTGDTSFTDNFARLLAAALYAKNSSVRLSGTSFFTKNSADHKGGAIYLDNSKITVAGDVSLENNSAPRGGGLFLEKNSKIVFASNLQLYATNNNANYGGVIYIADVINFEDCLEVEPNATDNSVCFYPNEVSDQNLPDPFKNYLRKCSRSSQKVTPSEECTFQFPTGDKLGIKLMFEHNSAAEAGIILFGGKLDKCIENEGNGTQSSLSIFKELIGDNITDVDDNETSYISSEPLLICPCVDGMPHCKRRVSYISVLPGEKFTLSIVAVGQGHGYSPTIIRSYFNNETAELENGEHFQITGKLCTNISYTVLSSQSSEVLILYPDGPCRDIGLARHTVHINILPCPNGFELMLSRCACEKRIRHFTNSCNANDKTIQRVGQSDFWLALMNNRSKKYAGLILHPHCPFDYCKSGIIHINLSDTNSQCAFHRSDMLCGSCNRNLSAVFGTSRCLQCSNAYLALIIPFTLVGIVLVFIILSCKITVAVGTIHGLVFYANIISINQNIFIPSGDTNILTVFIAWLNLDLGIETCFYNGMDTYAKTWLQFAFPLYIWAIVGFIVFISNYSQRVAQSLGKNPVAVLATLFLLSYAKILKALIASFAITFLEYPDGSKVAVWLYDGNIRYLHGKHVPLFVSSLLILVLVFLPYTLLLLLSQWLQSKSNKRVLSWMNKAKFRAFIDAYYAPYESKHRYWTGLLLILRCALFIAFALNFLGDSSINLLAIGAVSSLLAIIPWFKGRVYSSWYLNALEISFLLNLCILSAATYHVRLVGGSQAAVTYTSVSTAFVTFIGIFIYHGYTQLKETSIWKWCIKENPYQRVPTEEVDESESEELHESATSSVTIVELREPLLDDM